MLRGDARCLASLSTQPIVRLATTKQQLHDLSLCTELAEWILKEKNKQQSNREPLKTWDKLTSQDWLKQPRFSVLLPHGSEAEKWTSIGQLIANSTIASTSQETRIE